MKICMITSSYPKDRQDGAGTFVGSAARAIAALGHQVHVLAPYVPDGLTSYEDQGVYVHRFKYVPFDSWCIIGHGKSLQADKKLKPAVLLAMPLFCIRTITQALKLNRQLHFDVIHAHWAVPGGVLGRIVSKITKLPLVTSLHGSDVYLMQKNSLWRWIGMQALSHAQVTSCSDELLSRVQAMGLSGGTVISTCVDTNRFEYQNSEPLREKLGIGADQYIIGSMGRLVSKKGFEYLIQAMPSILETIPNALCVIGGDGDLRNELRTLADNTGVGNRILLPGHIEWSDAPSFYSMCDVVVIPSVVDEQGNVDGLPNVLVEAMSCERPIVATKVGGIPPILLSSQGGMLIPQGDVQSLTEVILFLFSNKDSREKLANNAYSFAHSHLSCENAAKKFIETYKVSLAEWGKK